MTYCDAVACEFVAGLRMLYISCTKPTLHWSFIHFTDISDEVRGVSERPYTADTRKPDVIVIDADDQKKRMEGLHRLETSEGKQASSMLRMLASGGTGKLRKP